MRAERLFRALGLVDPALVEEALVPRRRAVSSWKRWGAMAACLALVCALGWGVGSGMLGGYGGGMSGSSGGDSGGGAPSGAAGASGGELPAPSDRDYLWYCGPVLPLTTAEDPAGLTAERTVTWAMDPEGLRSERPRDQRRGTEVTDDYILRNTTEKDITVTALYPVAGCLGDLGQLAPEVTVDGAAAETAVRPGPVSGGYENAAGINKPYFTADLSTLDRWEEYKVLLESGLYQEWALAELPALDTPVTVYEFSDFAAPHDRYPAATQSVAFDVRGEETRIFTYGVEGLERSGDFRRYSFFVPREDTPPRRELKLLIVLGEDIGSYTLEGYQDGGCHPGEELDGVSCTVTRSEATLDAVLDRICRHAYDYDLHESSVWDRDGVPFQRFRDEFARLLTQYSLAPGTARDLCPEGRLDDLVWECWGRNRVLYTAFSVTVPAGGSAEVRCTFWRFPSSSPGEFDPERAGLQGYDLATRLGSALDFTAQRAALGNTEGFTLAEQNFGFDPEGSVTEVDLDLNQEYYYMDILEK